MARLRSKITALPSLIVCRDGKEKEFDSISPEDKKEVISLMCTNIAEVLSSFYSLHKDKDFSDNK